METQEALAARMVTRAEESREEREPVARVTPEIRVPLEVFLMAVAVAELVEQVVARMVALQLRTGRELLEEAEVVDLAVAQAVVRVPATAEMALVLGGTRQLIADQAAAAAVIMVPLEGMVEAVLL